MVALIPAVCPQCGAKLKIPEDTTKTNCQFCGTEILLDRGEIIHKGEIVHVHKEDVSDKVGRLYSLADKHLGLGNFVEAYNYSKQLIELDPDNPLAWFFSAVAGYMLGKDDEFAKGVREAQVIIERSPEAEKSRTAKERLERYFAALANEAPGWRKSKRPAETLRVGYAMLVVRPDDPLGWYYYGWAARRLGRETDSKHAFSQVSGLCDKNPNDERCKSIARMMSEDSRAEMVVKVSSFTDTIVKPSLAVLVIFALALLLKDVPIGGLVFGLGALIVGFTVAMQFWGLDTVPGYSLAVLIMSAIAFMVRGIAGVRGITELGLGLAIIAVCMAVIGIYHLLRLGPVFGSVFAILFSLLLAFFLKDIPYGIAFTIFAAVVLLVAFFQLLKLFLNTAMKAISKPGS